MKFLSCLIVALATIATVSATCCDFSTAYYCDWTLDESWDTHPPDSPDTTDYANFNSHDPDYAWLQDKSGTIQSVTTFRVSSISTVFTFDYYYYSDDPLDGDYLHVMFRPKGSLDGIRVASVTTPNEGWLTYNFTCDATVQYCCGSFSDLPCDGTVEIVGTLDENHNRGLFGIDNICGDEVITTTPYTTAEPTTTTAYTFPPPVPTFECCKFETNTCGFSIENPGWYWSENRYTSSITPYDGNYLWSETAGSIITSYNIDGIYSETSFSLMYYISSPNVNIQIKFISSSGSSRVVSQLYYSNNQWQPAWIQATDWCVTEPCQGRLEISVGGASNYPVAIDDTDKDGSCHGTLPCCYFDDPFYCQLKPLYPDQWLWSGNSTPEYPVPAPNPDTEFIYFETNDYTGSTDILSPLTSDVIKLRDNTTFTANVFVYTPDGDAGNNNLTLTFREQSTNLVTTMDFVRTTSNRWLQEKFSCFSGHGDCCQGLGDWCYGTLEFNAYVEANGGTVFYGIDALEIDDKCGDDFPGYSGPRSIPLKHKKTGN